MDEATLPEARRVVRSPDGIPLALELAAARLRTLSLPELADGLSDRFRLLTTGSRTVLPRHRTLRAVIAWSWQLLSEHERTVAERVSILPGGLTQASATAVCAGSAAPATEIPELLAGLVDRSLLQLAPAPGRYRMLETLREYGIDRLAATGDLGTVRDLAADYFAELMARCDPQLRGPGQLAAMRVISAEYDNALAALRRRCDTGDAPGAVALALNLTWYWQMFGQHSEAAYWLDEALAVPGGEPTPDRDCAHAIHLFNGVGTRPGMTGEQAADDQARLREPAARLLAYPKLPGPYGVLTALIQEEQTTLAISERLADLEGFSDEVEISIAGHAGHYVVKRSGPAKIAVALRADDGLSGQADRGLSIEVPDGQTVPDDRSPWNCEAAKDRRLNIAAGTSVRFEPGDECCVELVQIQGDVTAGGSDTSDLTKIQGLREGIVR
ncbi:urease subunit beta [Streptomyces javensis]|uniref:urease subunit beta n=1 Tax=Streptomyces javensis TaxID=114698 RepID=UPI0033C595E6